jgi:hypothetical protein
MLSDITDIKELNKRLESMGDEELDNLLRSALFVQAQRQYDPTGFAAYYKLLKGNDLPAHCMQWVKDIFDLEYQDYDGKLTLAFRGSWKSTTLSTIFSSFALGHNPEGSIGVISSNSTNADNITAAIAAIIENNPVFKAVFPHVIPDKDRGWGANGYWIRDDQYTIQEWNARKAGEIDPSFWGAGVESKIIGKHPTLLLILDDIHDENNSVSDLQRQNIVTKVSDTILPMAVKTIENGKRKIITRVLVIGTPWSEDDAYQYVRDTGQFLFSSFPVITKVDEGDEGAIYFDGHSRDGKVYLDMIGWWRINWPEMYNKDAIMAERAKSGLRGFARMFLLDLKLAHTNGLRYYTFPHEQIDLVHWALYGGVDFATVITKKLKDDPGRDKFSMAYGAKNGMNQLIVFDGIIEQCTQAQAEQHINKPQSLYPNWHHTVIEGDGSGEQFYIDVSSRNRGLRFEMKKTGGVPKLYRQERELGVWLERGMILISDADTPYLNDLRKALDDFPGGNNDIRDGLYWLGRAVPEVLVANDDSEGMPEGGTFGKKKNKNKALRYEIAKAIGGRN